LLRTLLLHAGCGWSLRETAVQARLAEIVDVSDVTLLNRLREAEPWLRQMCELLLVEQGANLQPVLEGRTMRLLDGTVVCESGPTGSQWRIHYSMRLPTLECDEFHLTPVRGKGNGEHLQQFCFHPGELILADAGYCHARGIQAVVDSHADLCLRLNPASLVLYSAAGKRFHLATRLRRIRQAGRIVEWPVMVQTEKGRVAGRVCVLRKSKEAIRQSDRRIELRRKRGKAAGPLAQQCAHYVMVFTTLSREQATAAQVLEMYRLRWQVELAFKRMKSLIQLGHLPKRDDRSSRAWLYAKLLLALLTEKMIRMARTISPWGYCLAPSAGCSQPLA